MGPWVAVIYAALMIYAYAHQIVAIHRRKSVHNLHLGFFFTLWLAVTLRLTSMGFVIGETHNISAIAMSIAELAVFLGLLIIVLQILWHRHKALKIPTPGQ